MKLPSETSWWRTVWWCCLDKIYVSCMCKFLFVLYWWPHLFCLWWCSTKGLHYFSSLEWMVNELIRFMLIETSQWRSCFEKCQTWRWQKAFFGQSCGLGLNFRNSAFSQSKAVAVVSSHWLMFYGRMTKLIMRCAIKTFHYICTKNTPNLEAKLELKFSEEV